MGSGGFLIQSHQYVEEQGQNPNDLALFGQDSNGTVWSICVMNMILHNITRFTIENGDTLEDPLILDNGAPRKFDRLLANPPFSQNYSRATLKFPSRFREWCPETGKKADLMFVQHMLASLKADGLAATIMPHGVLFRGGKEKLIRELFINDDVIEAIISLPPGLFYGTGIPACVIVLNKNKPDALRDHVLFINADREFAEGKNQNKLRPEDIEKIDFVFTHKRELPKYSRLVTKKEIVEKHDFNLNIRRYVDNTPDPEPEDVQAHLIGGVPEREVISDQLSVISGRFGLDIATLFRSERAGYLAFVDAIDRKSAIKPLIEAETSVQRTLTRHRDALQAWWEIARHDFSQLREGRKMPEVRQELLTTLKTRFIPLGVLDEFQSAGVFVNWWQQIRYDLKTIISTGWHHTLIPDNYLIAAFFQAEADAIEALEASISEAQSELAEAVEAGQELAAYEPEEDESITATIIKAALKELIDDLKDNSAASAKKELKALIAQEKTITYLEKRIKESKAELKTLSDELQLKLQLKRLGDADFKAENQQLLQQVNARIAEIAGSDIFQANGLKYDSPGQRPGSNESIASSPEGAAQNLPKSAKKHLAALQKDHAALTARLTKTDHLFAQTGGKLTDEEAKTLILTKLHDLASHELNRYLNAAKRQLIQLLENLWDKYAVSSRALETERTATLQVLDGFLTGLGYLK
jgi:type I restriction enzyme M protein